MHKRVKAQPSFQILIIDVLVFLLLGVSIGFIDVCTLKRQNAFSDSAIIGIGTTAFVFVLVGFIFYLFVEYKFNRLKFKNIFLYLGFVIAIGNTIAVVTMPNHMALVNDAVLEITPIMRVYYIASGFLFAILPYLYLYLIPRKINSKHYLDVMLYIILGFIMFTVLLSFIIDWNKYINFFDNPKGVGSIFFQKGVFALVLVTGMFISIVLRIRHKNWKWILCLIPCFIVLQFTLSKIYMLIGVLIVLIYTVIQLVILCKKSKDNLIITLLIVGLCLILLPLFIVGVIRSESGILAEIKKLFNDLVNVADTTLESRMLIWETTFKMLSSWRVIFGYGINSYGKALCLAYNNVTTWNFGIYYGHNLVVELLGNGGILLLGIYLFIYVYLVYIAIKIRNKENHWYIDSTLVFLALFTLAGMFESSYLCSVNMDFITSVVIISMIMSEYYLTHDQDEIKVRQELVSQAKKIKKTNFKSKLLTFNKKRLIYDAKYIAYDLNSKIKA